MQPYFDCQVHWLGLRFRHRALRVIEYLTKGATTLSLLLVHRPSVTWLQLPPTPLLYVAVIARSLGLTRVIVADCHHSMLWKPWINTPFLLRIFNRYVRVAIFHSQEIVEQATAAGFDEHRCYLLEDRPAVAAGLEEGAPADASLQVLFPASFDADEPVEGLLEAARRMPEVQFVFTGDHRRAKGKHDLTRLPRNVVLMGWVSTAEYKGLLTRCDLVISLTTQEGIQTSAAGEAVGYGKAMVLSDTTTLQTLYPRGAVHTQADPDSLETAIRYALDHRQELERGSRDLRAEREKRWQAQAEVVRSAVGASPVQEP